MAQSDHDKREALVTAMVDHVLSQGLAKATLRPLAKAAGTSDRMLLYYFPDKDALITALLGRVAQDFAPILAGFDLKPQTDPQALAADLAKAMTSPTAWPYARLWLDLAARAAWGEEPFRAIGAMMAQGYRGVIAQYLPDPKPEAIDLALTLLEGHLLLKAFDKPVAKAKPKARTARRA